MAERIDVFISSTSRDLTAYRDAITKVILRLGLHPIIMEAFNPTDRNALQLCYDKVQEAEIFIGIYAHRYGYAPGSDVTYTLPDGTSVAGDGEMGITHLEYLWAIERGLPMLLFVISDTDADGDPLAWPVTHIEDEPGKTRLKDFKNLIMGKHVVGFFHSPDHLATQVVTGLAELKTTFSPQQSESPKRRDFYKHIQLPPNYVLRSELIAELRLGLLDEEDGSVANKGITALHGMGGIGKSVMARALCDDPAIQTAYPDGILWTTLGQEPNIALKLREWVDALGSTIHENAPTVDSLKAVLAELLADRACLLVVDDVWQKKLGEAFRVGGENCRLLMTTRDAEIARNLGATIQPIPTMSLPEAIELLKEWAGDNLVDTTEGILTTLVTRLGRLPLAIKLAGAQLQRKSPEKWLERFDARKLEERRADADDPHSSLERCFGMSLSELKDAERKLYVALSIFKEDEPIREVAITRLWSGLDDLDEDDAQDLLDDLAARALLQVAGDEYPRAAVLHDLLRDFMAAELDDPRVAHRAMLDAYAETKTGDGWHTAFDDGYLYKNLTHHLYMLQDYDELWKLVNQPDWMYARVKDGSYQYDTFLIDLDIVWKSISAYEAFSSKALSRCMVCAAIETRINSILAVYPPELIMRAVELGSWSPEQAFAIIVRVPDPIKRINALSVAVNAEKMQIFRDRIREALLESIHMVNDQHQLVEALIPIVAHLSIHPLIRLIAGLDDDWLICQMVMATAKTYASDVSSDLFTQALRIRREDTQAYALTAVAFIDHQGSHAKFLREYIGTFVDKRNSVKVLSGLVSALSDPQLLEDAIALTISISDEWLFCDALQDITPFLDNKQIHQLFEVSSKLTSTDARAKAFTILAVPNKGTRQQFTDIAIQEIRSLLDDELRVNLLTQLISGSTYVQRCDLFQEAFETSQKMVHEDLRIEVVAELMSHVENNEQLQWLPVALADGSEWYISNLVEKIAAILSSDAIDYLTEWCDGQMKSPGARSLCLAALAGSAEHRIAIHMNKAMQVLSSVKNEEAVSKALSAMAKHFDSGDLERAFEILKAFYLSDASHLDFTVRVLETSSTHIDLDTILAIEDSWERAQGLARILPSLEENQRSIAYEAAFKSIYELDSVWDRSILYAKFVGYSDTPESLTEACRKEAIETLESLRNKSSTHFIRYLNNASVFAPPVLSSEDAVTTSRIIRSVLTEWVWL